MVVLVIYYILEAPKINHG